METIIFNDENLKMNDIDISIIKVRALIVNDKNEIFISKYNEIYMLPGGKVDKSENLFDALKREIKEETGIFLDKEIEPFLLVEQYTNNYPNRNKTSFENRLLKTYYFLIENNYDVNIENRSLTKSEQENSFFVHKINIDDAVEQINKNLTDDVRNKYFLRETLETINEYKKQKKLINRGVL